MLHIYSLYERQEIKYIYEEREQYNKRCECYIFAACAYFAVLGGRRSYISDLTRTVVWLQQTLTDVTVNVKRQFIEIVWMFPFILTLTRSLDKVSGLSMYVSIFNWRYLWYISAEQDLYRAEYKIKYIPP